MPRWQPGQSGNPYGKRPAVNAFRTLCQAFAPQAFEGIKELALTACQEAVRFQAYKFIVEQAYGKAPQSIEVRTAENILPAMMTTEQLKLAAAGQTQELVCSLIASGKINEYAQKESEAEEAILNGIRPIKDISGSDYVKEDTKARKANIKANKPGKRKNK